MTHWFEYVKGCYDLVLESEEFTNLRLDHEIESYIVHLMARNFNRTDIGNDAIAIKMLEAVQTGKKDNLIAVADECLLIHSYPLRKSKWPTSTYYQDIGITAYGMADHVMEFNFTLSARVLSAIFRRNMHRH